MRFLTTAALALALLAAAGAASADNNDNNNNNNGHNNTGHNNTGHTTTGHTNRTTPGGTNNTGRPSGATNPGGPNLGGPHGATTTTTAGSHNRNVAAGAPGGPPVNPGFGHNLRPSDAGRALYTQSGFPAVFRVLRRFHAVTYAQPPGWYARSWAYGDFLPAGWFAAPYYLDWGDYGLPEPPIGCEWVREGDDALLVDIWTGEVLSVEDGIFY